jgi:hypothetical protein
MPTVDDFADYPKAQISMGAGDLIDITDVTLNFEDGEKAVATLRQNPAGSTFGMKSVKLQANAAISHAGFERDWFTKYDKRENIEFRLKVPGMTFVIIGRLTTPSLGSNVDDVIKFGFSVIGRYQKLSS